MINLEYLEKVAEENFVSRTIDDLGNITTKEELSNWKGGIRNICENRLVSVVPGVAAALIARKAGATRDKALLIGTAAGAPGAIYKRWQDVNTVFPEASTKRKLVYGFLPLGTTGNNMRGISIPYIAGAKKYKQYREE